MNVDNKPQKIWKACLNFIKLQISEQSFKTWFLPIIPKKLEDQTLTIQVPSQFFYEWLEKNYLVILKKALHKIIGKQAQLEYLVVIDKGNHKNNPYTIQLPTKATQTHQQIKRDSSKIKKIKNLFVTNDEIRESWKTSINSNYTFDNFIEGDCNQLAKAASLAVAQKPGSNSFNPLVIYGEVGNGKTHISQAIGNYVLRNFSKYSVLYISSEKFTSQFIEGIRNNLIQNFINFYSQMDVLIIDDIQFLAEKEKTQEFFFNIFNHLHQSGKQIVLTSDSPPSNLKGLEKRLLSRFKWGLIADLQRPDFETRLAIIQSKIIRDGIQLPNELIRYIAYNVDTNVRELEGILISLMAHASLTKKDIDLNLTKSVIANTISKSIPKINIDFIQKTIAEYYKIPLNMMLSKSRRKEFVTARHLAMYLSKQYTSFSLKAIGKYFGGRDHSTVIHAIQAVDDLKKSDSSFQKTIEDVQNKIQFKSSM